MSDQGVMTTPIFDELASEIGLEMGGVVGDETGGAGTEAARPADEPRGGEQEGNKAG